MCVYACVCVCVCVRMCVCVCVCVCVCTYCMITGNTLLHFFHNTSLHLLTQLRVREVYAENLRVMGYHLPQFVHELKVIHSTQRQHRNEHTTHTYVHMQLAPPTTNNCCDTVKVHCCVLELMSRQIPERITVGELFNARQFNLKNCCDLLQDLPAHQIISIFQ